MAQYMLPQEWAFLELDTEPGYKYIVQFHRDYETLIKEIFTQTGRNLDKILYSLPNYADKIILTNQISINNIPTLNGNPLLLFGEVQKSNQPISTSKTKKIFKRNQLHYRVKSQDKSTDC